MIDLPPPPVPVVTSIKSIDTALHVAPAVFKSPGKCPQGVRVTFTKRTPDAPGAAWAVIGSCRVYYSFEAFRYNAAIRCTLMLHEWGHAAMGWDHMAHGVMRPNITKPHPACLQALNKRWNGNPYVTPRKGAIHV